MTFDLEYYKRKILETAKETGSNVVDFRKIYIPIWIIRELARQKFCRIISRNEIEIIAPLERFIGEKKEEMEKEESKEEVRKEGVEKYKGMLLDEKNPLNLLLGYDDLKLIVLRSLEESNIHFLFVGPPGTGKTLLIEGIEMLKQDDSVFIDGSHLTVSGLENLLMEYRPRYLLIDEIDKAPDKQIWFSLLNIMEFGRLRIQKYGKVADIPLSINIYATANRIDKLPEQLVDRFIVIKFREYTKAELKQIIFHCLTKIAGYPEDFAEAFTEQYVEKMKKLSIRSALRIAKLCKFKEDIDFVLNTLLKYS